VNVDTQTQLAIDYFLSLGFSGGGWLLFAFACMVIRALLLRIDALQGERLADMSKRAAEAERRAGEAQLQALASTQRLNDAMVYRINAQLGETNVIGTSPNSSGGD
jgi:hypothetical protein